MHTFHICLVGLSGNENVKGIKGIGKSCLCSRFLAGNKYDDYRRDHISYISLSDWHSSVINQNHWLYWGSCVKRIDNMTTSNMNVNTMNEKSSLNSNNNNSISSEKVCFHIIEQTEFINDESMQPFIDDISVSSARFTNNINEKIVNNNNNGSNNKFNDSSTINNNSNGSLLPYSKRCAITKLESSHKVVYRRKEQLSVEDYNYGKMPSEPILIDGFICAVDITQV